MRPRRTTLTTGAAAPSAMPCSVVPGGPYQLSAARFPKLLLHAVHPVLRSREGARTLVAQSAAIIRAHKPLSGTKYTDANKQKTFHRSGQVRSGHVRSGPARYACEQWDPIRACRRLLSSSSAAGDVRPEENDLSPAHFLLELETRAPAGRTAS